MSRKSDIFESVLVNPYKHDEFVDFVRELLNGVDMIAPTQYKKVYNNFSYYVDGYYHIGNYKSHDGDKIAILSVGLKKGDSVHRARMMQRNFIKNLIESGNCAGALVAFYIPEEPDKWWLSFIRLDYDFSTVKVIAKLTPAKRYSYLVGKGEPCNTAKQRLFPIFSDDDKNPGLDDMEKAFSVEKVRNEFFKLYCEKFHDLREYLEANDDFMHEAHARNFTSEQFAKKLLGQIVFLYFIQKKGWLGVDAISATMTQKDFMREIFERCRLFEQSDNYEWDNKNFNISNSIFSNRDEKGINEADGILDIFDRYNFTMNEDEPMEREVAIDPEMLGKVFENLLDVKDRKSKGTFYTPREIVQYMCQETLINYLVSKTGIAQEAIRDFILYGEYMRDEDTVKTLRVTARSGKTHYEIDKAKDMLISEDIFSYKKNVNRLKEIDELLTNVKIADLAVGSGAFPLGMLNEIVRIREVLTGYLAMEMNDFQKKSFYSYERNAYDLKVNTIKNCIFACDIEPSAVDIAKLRLWLSIIIDDETADDASSGEFDAPTKPRQLPNLECNIICGNSLVDEFRGNKLITESVLLDNVTNNSQCSVFQNSVDGLICKLIKLQDKLFFTKGHSDKEEIKDQIQAIYNDIILEQLCGNYSLKEAYFESLSQTSKPFVLWQLCFPRVFRDNGGFDIVIGNPPYVSAVTAGSENSDFRSMLKRRYPQLKGAFDLYVPFLLLGTELVNRNGGFSWIIPNKILVAKYAEKAMETLKKKGLYKSISVSGIDVFHNVGVYPIIVLGFRGADYGFREFEVDELDKLVNRKLDEVDRGLPYQSFLDFNIKIASGTTGFQAQQIKEYLLNETEKKDKMIPFIVSGSVDPYVIDNNVVHYMKKIYKKPYVCQGEGIADSKWKFWNQPKIIIAGMSKRIEAIYCEEPMGLGVGIYGIYDFSDYDPKALTAVLNSSLMTYFITTMFKEKHLAGGYLAINKNTLEKLPLVKISINKQAVLSKLYDEITSRIKKNENYDDIQEEIDDIVCELYDFEKEKIMKS